MTLRYDRLDNFWFTLAHELAHVHLHLHDRSVAFFDDIDHAPCNDDDPREVEANAFARNLLIPDQVWRTEGQALMEADQARCYCVCPTKCSLSGYCRWTPAVGRERLHDLF